MCEARAARRRPGGGRAGSGWRTARPPRVLRRSVFQRGKRQGFRDETPAGRARDLLAGFVNVGVQPRFLVLLLRGTRGLLLPREEREHGRQGAFGLGRLAWGLRRAGNLNCCFREAAERSAGISLR